MTRQEAGMRKLAAYRMEWLAEKLAERAESEPSPEKAAWLADVADRMAERAAIELAVPLPAE